MKKTTFIIVLLISALTLFAAQVKFDTLSAKPEGDNVLVEWAVNNESGIKKYEVKRASSSGFYKKLDERDPKGSGYNYKFIDPEAFIKNVQGKENRVQEEIDLKYRIYVVYTNGNVEHSKDIDVTYKISSVKRTWGMIKELFK